ncbi:MAG TPA: PAS domain-containing protein [Usitatibacter sp.]|nr:PAS domain-containing protein [Usitatibacter sp.]
MDHQSLLERPALEARLAALKPGLDLLAMPACVLDTRLRYHYINPAYTVHSGRAAAEFIGHTPDEVFSRKPSDSRRAQLQRALEGETVVFNRQNIEGPNAGRWVRAHYMPLRDDGNVVGVLIVLVDIQQLKDAEEALARQRKQMQLVVDNIGVPMSYIDRDWRFRFANQPGVDWLIADTAEAIGKRVQDMFDPQTVELITPEIEAAFRGEKRIYERLAQMQNGVKRWVRVHLLPDLAPDGTVQGLYSLMIDVDADRRNRDRLEQHDAQLRTFTDNIPDAVAYLNRERRILFANRHFALQRGTTPEEIVGRTTPELMGEEMASWIKERTQKVFDSGETATYERVARMSDGSERHYHVKAVPDFDESGSVRGMYVVAHDITDVKEAQQQIAAREQDLRFFAENIPEAIVYVDLVLGCTFVNNVFLATRGFTREFALGKFPPEVYPAEVMVELQSHIDRAIAGHESAYERVLRMPTGAERWVRVRITPRRGDGGNVVGYYVVSTDIHDIKVAHAAIEDKERQLRQVIDSIPTPMCYVDAGTHYRYVNDAFLDYIGKPASEIVGRAVREVLGDERFHLLEPILERVRKGESLAVERLVRFADGRARWMNVRLSPRFVDGQYLGYYATTSDIHEQKAVEEELRRANTILSAHFDNTPLAVIEWDTGLRVVRWSGQAEPIFGWQASEMLGRSLTGWRLIYEEDEAAATDMISGLVNGRERHSTLLHRNYRKDGSVIWVEWHNSALRDESGRVISILSLAQDVSSRIQAEERLQFMATHDGLTALPNSVLLNDRLAGSLQRAQRARRRVGVMFLDLDHFKDVNDTLGHRVGDLLLKEVSRRFRAALRQSDLLARISGDEFVVVLEDLPDDAAPDHVARKLLDEVRRPFQIEGHEIHVSGSLGLALYPEDGSDAETLLKNADAAMYHAKELGRNSFRLFSTELGQRRAHRMQVEAALRRALKNNELRLHFQPIMEIATGRVSRAEALLRWHDPEKGLVLPAGFIPLAEETGLGHAIGHWVLENAAKQAREWRDRGLGDIVVCVNLSASQLRDTSMIADLKKILTRNGCEPGWLQFEITETSMVRDVEGASLVLAKLRALGVRVAIDDFGTGFSSLSHLRHLPVDVLKVDKGFVADIESAKRGEAGGGAAIVSAVIGLARGLGLDVVAEGVEKSTQLAFLQREGCNACQGYLICPPLPADEFANWLKQRGKSTAKKKPVKNASTAATKSRKKVRR